MITYTSYEDLKLELQAIIDDGVSFKDAAMMMMNRYKLMESEILAIMAIPLHAVDAVIEKIDGGQARIAALDKTIEDFDLNDREAMELVAKVNDFEYEGAYHPQQGHSQSTQTSK